MCILAFASVRYRGPARRRRDQSATSSVERTAMRLAEASGTPRITLPS